MSWLDSLIAKFRRPEPGPTPEQNADAQASEMRADAINEFVEKRDSGEDDADRYTTKP